MRQNNLKRQSILAAAILAGLSMTQAQATVLYWDQDGDTSASTGGTGNWNLGDLAWRPGSVTGTPLQAWVNSNTNDAVLPDAAGTLTLGTSIVANSLEFGGTGAYKIIGGGNTLNLATIKLDNTATQLISADFASSMTSLTVTNNNAGVGAAGATVLSLQGAQAMASTLTTLNLGGGGAGASYSKNNQLNLWNPFVDPFVPGVFNDGARNPWAIATTINVTGDYAMISGSTPGTGHAATHIFTGPVHLNNNILLLAAPLGNSLQFNNVIDSTGSNGGVVITGTTPTANNTGQGAVIFAAAMTYAGPTRIMNTSTATGGGILRFLVDNALPTSTQLIWGDVGFGGGYMNLNGTDQTVGSLETTPSQAAGGIFDNNANHFHDGRGYRIVNVSGNRTTTFAAPIGQLNQDGDAGAVTAIQLNFGTGNTGSTTLTNGNSQYSAGTVVAGGVVISKNTINDFTNSPVGTGPVTVSNSATFGGSGQVIGPVSHSGTSHLAPGGVSAVDTSNPLDLQGGLTLTGTPNLDFEFNGFGNDMFTTPSLDLSGASTVNLNLFNLGSGIHNGDFTLIDYGTTTATNNSQFTLNNLTGSGASFTLNPFNGDYVSIHVTGAANTLIWKGTDGVTPNANWNTTAVNWSGPSKFTNGDFATFDDTASEFTVQVAGGGVLPATMTVNANSDYTFNGGGISSSTLVKHLAGMVTFNNANTFSGGITGDGGTVAFGASGTDTGGAVSLTTATLALSAGTNLAASVPVTLTNSTLRADASLSAPNNTTFSGTSGTINTQSNSMTLSGVLGGSAPLSKQGAGLLKLSGAGSSLTGAITVSQGTLAVSNASSTGTTGAGTGIITVNNGATLDVQGVRMGYVQASGATAGGSGTTSFTLQNGSTLKFSGESGMVAQNGGQGIQFQNFASGNPSNINIQTGSAGSRFAVRNFIKNTTAASDVNTTVHLLGDGIFQLTSGSLGTTTGGLQFTGTWSLEMGSTGVMAVGPIISNNNTEVLQAPGYNPTFTFNATRPFIVSSGTLAVGADAKNPNTAASNTTTGVFRSPVTLSGGNIASTGREYSGVTPNATASSATPVAAKYGADITLSDGTASKVLLYEPVALGNIDGTGTPAANPGGGRNVRFVTEPSTGLSANFAWGSNTTLTVDSGAVSGGTLSFERTTGTVSVGTNANLVIGAGGTVQLGGTIDALSNGTNHVNVLNNSTLAGLSAISGTKNVGAITGTGNTAVSGGAVLQATSINQNSLNVANGGKAVVRARVSIPAGAKVNHLNTLGLNASGTLDLNDNDLVVANGSFTALQALVFQGYRAGPDTTATGIVSSTSQNVAGGATILALFDNSLAGFGDWPQGSGNTISGSAIVGKYTYIGDTNMDGQVTPQDYTATDSNLGTSVDPAISWFYGDTNFDGNIDPTDYAGIDGALGLGQGNPLAAQGLAAVPEPASLGMLGIAGAGLILRRRRRGL
jgi:fibronectin-binding autotransporter adhesin